MHALGIFWPQWACKLLITFHTAGQPSCPFQPFSSSHSLTLTASHASYFKVSSLWELSVPPTPASSDSSLVSSHAKLEECVSDKYVKWEEFHFQKSHSYSQMTKWIPGLGRWLMAKCLLCKHKDLSLDSPVHVRSWMRQHETATWGRAEGGKRLLRAHRKAFILAKRFASK